MRDTDAIRSEQGSAQRQLEFATDLFALNAKSPQPPLPQPSISMPASIYPAMPVVSLAATNDLLLMPQVALRRIEPARNCFRQYAIAEIRTLFEENALLISWGRIGKKQRIRCEAFASKLGRDLRKKKLLIARLRHGYAVPA